MKTQAKRSTFVEVKWGEKEGQTRLFFRGEEHKQFKKAQKHRGGFSLEVSSSPEFVAYASQTYVHGYIGHGARTNLKDRMVEEALRATGLKGNGIASWLSSTSGRHMGNALETSSLSEQRRAIKDYTKNAFMDVAVWNHPDHDGCSASSDELRKKFQAAFAVNA